MEGMSAPMKKAKKEHMSKPMRIPMQKKMSGYMKRSGDGFVMINGMVPMKRKMMDGGMF